MYIPCIPDPMEASKYTHRELMLFNPSQAEMYRKAMCMGLTHIEAKEQSEEVEQVCKYLRKHHLIFGSVEVNLVDFGGLWCIFLHIKRCV